MLDFVHHRVSEIEGFLASFNDVQILLGERSYTFESEFDSFLKKMIQYFEKTGNSAKQTEVQKNHNLLQTVRKGFDPIKLEKISTGKREAYWGFAFHCTANVGSVLQEILTKEMAKLEEAQEILDNTVLNLVQANILNSQKLKELDSAAEIELFWTNLVKQNDSISLINKKLRLKLISEDIYLILEKIISKIQ